MENLEIVTIDCHESVAIKRAMYNPEWWTNGLPRIFLTFARSMRQTSAIRSDIPKK
jgi:hypothetical protein